MRRACVVTAQRGAQVAVYDALLFLMVVILVSTGMFLYSAKITSVGPGFTSATYTDLAESQLNATLLQGAPEGLNVSRTGPGDPIGVSLREVFPPKDISPKIDWVLAAYSYLTYNGRLDGTDWDLVNLTNLLGRAVTLTAIDGLEYAWALSLDDEVLIHGSSVPGLSVPEGLPGSRWASSDLVDPQLVAMVSGSNSKGTLWYYLWPA